MYPDWLAEFGRVVAGLVGVLVVLSLTLGGPLIFVAVYPYLPEAVGDALGEFPVGTLLAVTLLSFGAAAGFLVYLSRSRPFPEWL
jgi:hypothetical protein